MERIDIIGLGMMVAICLIAIPLAKLLSKVMFAEWKKLAVIYPGGPLESLRTIRFTSITLQGGFLPLQLNQIVHLCSTNEMLGLRMSILGASEILIPKSAVESCKDESLGFFPKLELTLKESPISIMFRGRSARFVREWWMSNMPHEPTR